MKTTTFRILGPADQAALEAYLQPLIESSMFFVSNSRKAGLQDFGQRFHGTYAAAFDGDKMMGVVAHFWNQNLILQAAQNLLEQLVYTAVFAAKRPIKGVIGPQKQVQTVLDLLATSPEQLQVDEPEHLYSLPLAGMVLPDPLQSGRWRGRLVGPDDIELMTSWRVGYALEALGETDTPLLWRQMRQSVNRSIQFRNSWILEDTDLPVATSSFNAKIKEMVQVGGVWTPPDMRSQGYGRGAVAASLLAERKTGVGTAILFTGVTNIPAQKAYEALGFQRIGDYRITLLKTAVSLA